LGVWILLISVCEGLDFLSAGGPWGICFCYVRVSAKAGIRGTPNLFQSRMHGWF
jgi:hypothetical protein